MKNINGHVIIRAVLAFLLAVPAPAFSAVINGELKKARLENLSADPTGTNGKVYFNTTTTKGRIYNGTAWTDIGSGSGGGGFTDQITNGNAEDTLVPTAWSTYNDGASAAAVDGTGGTASQITAIARDTTSGNLINGTATWKMVKSAANAQGQGWSYAFTPPANWSGRNSLVSLTFNYFMSTASGDDIRVYLYDVTNSTLITPSFVTCGGGTAPKLTATTSVCQAKLAWVSSGATSYRLLFHVATTLTTAMNVFMDDISITDYRAQPGQNVGEWQSYTPTGGWTTNTTYTGKWRREGDSAHAKIKVALSGAPNATQLRPTVPTGCTIDTTKLPSTTAIAAQLGYGMAKGAGSNYFPVVVEYGDTTSVKVYNTDDAASAVQLIGELTATSPYTFASGDEVNIDFTVPCSEWAGGTSFGENQVEYAYNTGNVTTAGGSDTSSFAYGPAGTPILGYDSTTVSSLTGFLVRFKSPIQATDRVEVEVNDGNGWQPASQRIPYIQANTSKYGITTAYSSTPTDVTVYFSNKGATPSGAATYAASGETWSSYSAFKWRVKKFSSGVPVPFGLATSTTPGLYQAGAAPGFTTGTAVAAGNIGEELVASNSGIALTTATIANGTSKLLTAGHWRITASGVLSGAASQTAFMVGISTDSTASTFSDQATGNYTQGAASSGYDAAYQVTKVVNLSASTTYYLKLRSLGAGGTASCVIHAIRLD